MINKFRLILDPPRGPSLNMAIDELLMESQSYSGVFPALRVYSWSEPSYSVGYFQNVSEIAQRFECEKKKLPVVRRMTGGGLVFHGKDITFSITAKSDHPYFLGEPKTSYLRVNEALRGGLEPLYPKIDYADCKKIPTGRGGKERVCFEAPSCYDLLLLDKKIVGASQRRKNGTVLHQSSIFLSGECDTLRENILEGFKKEWKIDFLEQPLTEEEVHSAKQKEKKRYASADWAYLPALERSFFS